MSTTVTYKGNTLTTVNNITKTLRTAGKYMEGDVILVDDSATGSVYQDNDGYLVVDDSESSAPQGNLSITANGTYDVADYAGVTVNMQNDLAKKLIDRSITASSFEWPDDLTTIGAYAFAGCTSLNITEIPSSVTSIGGYAFYDLMNAMRCTSLPSGLTYIGDYAFNSCTRLALSSLPSTLSHIGNYAFRNCIMVTISVIPNSCTEIGNGAFQNCSGITSISGLGVTYLAQSAFIGSSSYPMALTSASFPSLTGNLSNAFGNTTAANACKLLEFADVGNVGKLYFYAFANCNSLQTLVLRKNDSVCALDNLDVFLDTPMRGYNGLTGTVYVPSALISTYQTATNWSTLYNAGTVTFVSIEGSEYER